MGFMTLVFVCVWASALSAKDASSVAVEKLQQRPTPAPMSAQSFQELLLSPKTRDFGVFVMFTAEDPKYGCKHCIDFGKDFSLLARSYMAAEKELKGDTLGHLPMFFASLDYGSAPGIFGKFGFKTVPVLIYLAPKEAILGVEAQPEIGYYEVFSGSLDVDSLKKFIESHSKAKFELLRSVFWVYVSLILFSALLVLSAPALINNLPMIMRHVRSKPIWMLVCAAAYVCSISGFVYDIIRNPQLYHVNRGRREITIFHPSNGAQFFVEGFIIGFLNIACSIAVIVLVRFASVIQHRHTRAQVGLICVALFSLFFYLIISLYRVKNRWYMR